MTTEQLVTCPGCDGTGEVHSRNPKCWDCDGKGLVTKAKAKSIRAYDLAMRNAFPSRTGDYQ